MDYQKIESLILTVGILNYLLRAVPLVALSRVKMPRIVLHWLELVPTAILSVMVAYEVLGQGGVSNFSFYNSYLWASLGGFAIAWFTRNLGLTLLVGIGCMLLLRWLFGQL